MAKKRSHDWDQERIERLAAHYLELRDQIWRPLAQVIGESWEEVEKKVGLPPSETLLNIVRLLTSKTTVS